MEPNSIDVARAVMTLVDVHGLRLNLTQLQKLLYIVYGTCLVTLGHPPFRNEQPRAWPFGPVFRKSRRVLFDPVDDWDVPQMSKAIPDDVRCIIKKSHHALRFMAFRLTYRVDVHASGSPWDMMIPEIPDSHLDYLGFEPMGNVVLYGIVCTDKDILAHHPFKQLGRDGHVREQLPEKTVEVV